MSKRPGSEGLVTPSTLSSQLGFLPSTPAWPEVQRAMDRLSRPQAEADPEFQQDVRTIGSYARMLRDNRELLTGLLVTGLALGRLGSAGKRRPVAEQLLSGLSALSWANDGDSAGTKGLVKRIWGWIREQRPELGDTIVGVDQDWDFEEWSEVTERRLQAIAQQVKPSRPLVDSARADSWHEWELRIGFFLAGSPPQLPLGGYDVLCRSAGVSPASLLRAKLDVMTIQEWSRLAYLPFAREVPQSETVPPWIHGAASWVLGFPAAFQGNLSTPHPIRVLMVRRSRDSQANKWRPAPDAAVMALTADECWDVTSFAPIFITQLFKEEGAFKEAEVGVVAFEISATERQVDLQLADALIRAVESGLRRPVSALSFDSARPSEPPNRFPFFVVQQVADLANAALALGSRPPT